MAELFSCKFCGSQPKVTAQFNRKTRKVEFGHLCSNRNCKQSYFCVMYESIEKSSEIWNNKNKERGGEK
jgi:hypothetical protein